MRITEFEDLIEAIRAVMKEELAIAFKQKKERLLTAKEAAEMLKVSTKTIMRYVKSGDLNYVKLGNRPRIQEEEIQKFILKKKWFRYDDNYSK